MEYRELEALAKRLSALAHPVRLDLVVILGGLVEATAGSLQHEVEVSQPEVSRHLAVLERAGLVKVCTVSRYKYYRLADRKLPFKLADI